MKPHFEFSAPVWKSSGKAAWHFITLPKEEADYIRDLKAGLKGFGMVKVIAQTGDFSWETSIFPDTKTDSYLLPVKANIRRKAGIEDGQTLNIKLTLKNVDVQINKGTDMHPINLMKLVVGIDTLEDFEAWQKQDVVTFEGKKVNTVHTRNMPKQAEEILASGGSIYRIMKGTMYCRQKIVGFKQYETENGKKCIIYTDTKVIPTQPLPMRAFQGWRYLKPENTPADLDAIASGEARLSHAQEEQALRELGLLD